MTEKIIEWFKELLIGSKPFLRKLRILRYVGCIIIIFIVFCDSYWNLLEYINLPCPPLLSDYNRNILNSTGMMMVVVCGIYSVFFHNIYKIVNRKYWINISYIDILIDFLFTAYFFVYSLNLGIEYANGVEVYIQKETILAIVYLIYCTLGKSYFLHRSKYEQDRKNEYTEYCDRNGQRIPLDVEIFYKGKEHRVVKYEGIYRLLPYDERIISSGLIKLEDAASDMYGNLLLKEK